MRAGRVASRKQDLRGKNCIHRFFPKLYKSKTSKSNACIHNVHCHEIKAVIQCSHSVGKTLDSRRATESKYLGAITTIFNHKVRPTVFISHLVSC